jgi:hypothetical protein
VLGLAVAGLAAAAIASAAGAVDLHDAGDLHEAIGQSDTKHLLQGTAYTASAFPIAVRIHAPDALWEGVQHESGSYRFIQLSHLHVPGTAPLVGRGYVTLESATVATPSAAKVRANLRATPHAQVGPTRSVTVAGLRGRMFDVTITGRDNPPYCHTHPCQAGVSLVPFTKNLHCGFCNNTMHGETQDVKFAGLGQLFRIIVLQAHRKTVVIYIESIYADQKKFPTGIVYQTFLPYAKAMLGSLSLG